MVSLAPLLQAREHVWTTAAGRAVALCCLPGHGRVEHNLRPASLPPVCTPRCEFAYSLGG